MRNSKEIEDLMKELNIPKNLANLRVTIAYNMPITVTIDFYPESEDIDKFLKLSQLLY